jgi:molybdate transport system permease protein
VTGPVEDGRSRTRRLPYGRSATDSAPSRGRWSAFALAIAAGLGMAVLVLPIAALVLGTPWRSVVEAIVSGATGPALLLSVLTTLIATGLCVVLGVPLAWWMSRQSGRSVRFVRALVLLPLVLPPVAGGVALLLLLGRNGPIGQLLDQFGVSLPFSTTAVVLSQTFVAIPFMVLAAEAAFRSVDRQQYEVARTLGASQWRQFASVAWPLAAPGIAAGALLSWARAFGEFGATVTFAGSLPGVTETLPLAVYRALETDQDSAIALAVVMLAVSIVVVLVLGTRWLPLGGFGSPTRDRLGRSAVHGSADPVTDGVAGFLEPPAVVEGRNSGAQIVDEEVPDGNLQAVLQVPRPEFDVAVSLAVAANEIAVISGPNGAGKSTVLLALAGLVEPEQAEVSVGARSWDGERGHLRAEDRNVGWVPQNGQLFWHMSVLDNLAFGLRCHGSGKSTARQSAQAILAEHGLSQLADRPASTLSGGQARRIAILRAVAVNPEVLLLDEPTNGLDDRSRSAMICWLKGWLAQYPIPTILVTHDQQVARELGTELISMDLGQLVESESQEGNYAPR